MGQNLDDRPIRFLREAGARGDSFGSHDRLARAIAVALDSNPELQVVGLLGAWGSGKSTVVDLVAEKLRASDVKLFVYDAWVHQSDAPRRAFLEEFMRFLKREKLANPKKLGKELDKLLGRREVTKTTSRPELAPLAGLVLALILAVPLATKLLDPTKAHAGDWEVKWLHLNPWFFCELLIVGLPSVLLFALSTIRGFQRLVGLSDKGGQFAAIFANKGKEVRIDERRKDPDPTALEFQRLFRRIIAKVSGPRLILVIDNLDRLPDGQALELWSTIRGLFHGRPDIDEPTVAIPSVILPIDEAAILRLHKDDPAVAEGFSEKTFDLVFRVPMPILSRWRLYLEAKLREVFGDRAQNTWLEVAARVLEAASPDTRTPRSINVFVNQAAALWLQWRDQSISFASIAYYLANRTEIDRNAWDVLRNPVPWMEDFDPDWATGVAALRYGVEPSAARQILIDDPTRKALRAGQYDEIVASAHMEGFTYVFDRILNDIRFYRTEIPWSHAVLALAQLPEDRQLPGMWRALVDGLQRSPEWTAKPLEVRALTTAIVRAPLALKSRLLNVAKARLEGIARGEWDPFAASSFVTAVNTVISAADRYEVGGLTVTLPGDATAAITLMSTDEAASLRLDHVRLNASAEDIEVALAHSIPPLPNPWTLVGTARRLAAVCLDFSWARYASALLGKADDAEFSDEADITTAQFFDGLSNVLLASDEGRDVIVRDLPRDLAADRLKEAAKRADDDFYAAAAFCLASGEVLAPDLDWEALLQAGAAVQGVEERLAVFSPETSVESLVEFAARHASADPMVRPLIIERLRVPTEHLNPEHVVTKLEIYLRVLPGKERDLIWRQVGADQRFWRALRGGDPETNLPLALEILKSGFAQDAAQQALTTLSRLLGRTSAGQLAQGIRLGGPVMESLADVAASPTTGRVGGELSRALAMTLDEVLSRNDAALAERWFRAAQGLATQSRGATFRGLRRRLAHAGAPVVRRLLEVGGEPLLVQGLTPRHADELLATLLIKGASARITAPLFAAESRALSRWSAMASADRARKTQLELADLLGQVDDEGHREEIRRIGEALTDGRRKPSATKSTT